MLKIHQPLEVYTTDAIRLVLSDAAGNCALDKAIREQASNFASANKVPWRILRDVCKYLRQTSPMGGSGPWLHHLCRSGGVHTPSPPLRIRSPEVEARLAGLKAELEAKQYASMVRGATALERAAEDLREGGLQTYKQQMSFGVHVVLMMGAFFVMGHTAGGAISPHPAYRAAGGLAGLVLAMLLETVLLILRSNCAPELHQKDSRGTMGRKEPAPLYRGTLALDHSRATLQHGQGNTECIVGAESELKKDI